MSRDDDGGEFRRNGDPSPNNGISITSFYRRNLSVVGCCCFLALVLVVFLLSLAEQRGIRQLLARLVRMESTPSHPTTTTSVLQQRSGTLVVYLSGQMGNHMHFVARAYGLQQYAARMYHLDLQLVYYVPLFDDNNQEALTTKRQLEQAFPQTFVENDPFYVIGSSPSSGHEKNDILEDELKERMQHMNDWMGDSSRLNQRLNSNHPDEWQQALSDASSLSKKQHKNVTSSITFPLPLLEMRSMESHWFVNEYYDSIRTNLFQMDDDRVCGNQLYPEHHEWVLHYRHFRLDVPNYYEALGFEELEPAALVESSLFDYHVPSGTHVAIVGYKLDDTKPGTSSVQTMLNQSFIKHGFVPRFVTHEQHAADDAALQDFCFLRHTQQTLVGTWRSTFCQWAAYLGNASHVQLYVLDSPEVRTRFGNDLRDVQQQLTNWTHPKLKGRFESPIIVKREKGEN